MDLVGDPTQLWTRAQAGNQEAREELFALAEGIVREELCKRRAPASDIDDLVQRASTSILGFLDGGGKVRSNLAGFLKGRAWGVLSDLRRSTRASTREIDVSSVAEPASAEGTPLSKTLRSELSTAFQACLEGLEAKLMETFSLCYCQGLETPTIAARYTVTESTVYVRLFRARARLRDCLKAKGFGSEDLP